ncbi:thioesterase family protein [Xylanibacter caecicola]|nr:thioesterase family protein [Xylanibacter caecicola]
MEIGIKFKSELKVTEADTAVSVGSGTLRVLATPVVITLIEKTAWKSIDRYMDNGCCTVGTALDIEHLAPTPVGMTVTCETTLTAVDGRRLVFQAEVNDADGLTIAKGTHTRFIVDGNRFQEKADKLLNDK